MIIDNPHTYTEPALVGDWWVISMIDDMTGATAEIGYRSESAAWEAFRQLINKSNAEE